MNNYVETKKELDKIRSKYGCKGEVLFRTAIQYVVDCGQQNFQDDAWVKAQLDIVDKKHDAFDREKKTLFICRDFEKAIIECAAEIAKVNTYNLLIYIQREVWLSNEGIDYQRAVELLKSALEYLEGYNNCNNKENYEAFVDIGVSDYEMEMLGFEYLVYQDDEDDI